MVLAQSAHADPLVGVFGNYTHLGGVQAGGFGLDVELRAKRGSVQYFAEGAVAYLMVGATDSDQTGLEARTGAGVRWIARSVGDRDGGFDLYLEAGAGLEGYWWSGRHVVRPDATIGWGWQVRAGKTVSLRSGLRALLANDQQGIAVACRGCASSPAETVDMGMLAVMGMTW
jgi:hypothetical protein